MCYSDLKSIMESQITFDKIVAESGVKLKVLEKECAEENQLKLAKYCDPISVIGHALGLTQPQITAIENDYRTTEEKRLALMKVWKQTYAFNATYKKFIEALLASGRAEQATEICRLLAAENKASQPDNHIIAASNDTISDICTSAGDATDLSVTSDPTLTTTGASTPTLTSDDVQRVPFSESVPSKPPAHAPIAIAPVADKMRKLEREYRKIGRRLIKSLKRNNISLEDLQDYVATLPPSVLRFYEELQTNLLSSQTNKATCVSEFVEAINKYSNILSPALLADVIEEYGDEETKSMMNEYSEKLEQFQTETQVKQLVGVFHAVTPEGYTEIGLELKDNWEEKTLKDIAPPKQTWLFKKVYYGSLRVVFSIANIEDLEEEDVREYLQRHVKRVFVNGKCVLNFETDEFPAWQSDVQLCDFLPESTDVSVTSDLKPAHFITEESGAILGQTTPEESETVQLTEIPSDFRFSSASHGMGIILSEDGLEARGKGGVYVATPLQGTCEFEVEVTDCGSSIGSLKIGVSQCPTGTYKHLDIPHKIRYTNKDSCVWSGDSVKNGLSGDIIETKYGSMDLRNLKKGDKVAVRLSENGDFHFFLNGVNQGLASRNVYREGWDTYPVIRVIGSCKAVKITRAVIQEYAKGHRGQQSSENISPHNIQFGFHPVTGGSIVLLEDGLYARRLDPEYKHDGGVVYSAMPIKHRGTFEVVITERTSDYASIQIGVMRQPTNTELKQSDIPYDSCHGDNHFVWMGDKVYNNLSGLSLWGRNYNDRNVSAYGRVNLNNLQEGDKVGLRLSSDGTLSFFVNGKNQEVAARGLHQEGYDIYPMVNVQWNCHAVRITRAETHSEDEVPDLQELCVEKIASCLDSGSSKDMNLLPLPQRLRKQIEQYIDWL